MRLRASQDVLREPRSEDTRAGRRELGVEEQGGGAGATIRGCREAAGGSEGRDGRVLPSGRTLLSLGVLETLAGLVLISDPRLDSFCPVIDNVHTLEHPLVALALSPPTPLDHAPRSRRARGAQGRASRCADPSRRRDDGDAACGRQRWRRDDDWPSGGRSRGRPRRRHARCERARRAPRAAVLPLEDDAVPATSSSPRARIDVRRVGWIGLRRRRDGGARRARAV